MKKSPRLIELRLKSVILFLILFALCVSFALFAIGITMNKTSLPENITIQILDYDLDDSSALILGTEPEDELIGRWSAMSNSESGVFVNIESPLTTFRGNLFENYLLRWTITDGVDEIYAEELINVGKNFTLAQLLNADIDINILSEKYSIRELINAGVPIGKLVDKNISAERMLDAGASSVELLDAGVSARKIISAGIPILDLSDGFSKDELIESGVIAKIPETDLLVLNYFGRKFEPAAAAEFCENLSVGGVDNWRLPSIEELRKIYEFKNMLGYGSENWFEAFWSSTFSHYGTDESGTLPNYWTKNMSDGDESTYYGFAKRIIPVADDDPSGNENYK